MTKYDISNAIGNVSDKFIMESMMYSSEDMAIDAKEDCHSKSTKHHSFRKIASIAVAACLVLALSVTALAAAGVNLLDYFRSVFDSSKPGQEEVLARVLASGGNTYISNGTSITPLAVISDDVMCYISLRVDAPEGTELSLPEEGNTLQLGNPDEWVDLIVDQKSGKPISGTSDCTWSDPVPGDNSLNVVISYVAQVKVASFSKSNDIRVCIHNIWLQNQDKEYSVFLEGDWTFDFSLQNTTPKEIDVKGLDVNAMLNGKTVEWEDMSITLKDMILSPFYLEVSYNYTSPDKDNVLPTPGTVQIVMKDGSIIKTNMGNGIDTASGSRTVYILTAPIDLSNVDYVQFGNQEIPVN
ncbi:MAG: DUF4179 domain-containing protein [Eubacteriales bacterium]|nr:DUF4179 domain-containing protein [Eubacteriales bacterium]